MSNSFLDSIEERARQRFHVNTENELARLSGTKNYPMRRRTIIAIALSEVTPGQSWNDALKRPDTVSPQVFYSAKKDWYSGTSPESSLFREVLNNTITLYRNYYNQMDMRLQEARRQQHIDKMLELTDLGMEKLRQMLNYPISNTHDETNGVIIVAPTFNWSSVATLLKMVDERTRLALNLPTSMEMAFNIDFSSLTDAELEELSKQR